MLYNVMYTYGPIRYTWPPSNSSESRTLILRKELLIPPAAGVCSLVPSRTAPAPTSCTLVGIYAAVWP